MSILPYTYIIVNTTTSEYYYGSRFKNTLPARQDLGKRYLSSSKVIKAQIRDFGLSAFTFTVLFEGEHSVDSYYWLEQLLIMTHIADPKCLNQQYVDPNTNTKKWSTAGLKTSDEVKLKMSIASKGKPKSATHRANIALANKKKATDPTIIAKLKKPKPSGHGRKVSIALTGVKKTAEHRAALSLAQKGRKTGSCTEKRKVAIRNALLGRETGHKGKTYAEIYGAAMAEKLKKLRSESAKRSWALRTEIVCPHCTIVSKSNNNMKRWHFDNCKERIV